MLEHHLTIVQLKSVFITSDNEAIVVHDGLHPNDAEDYGLQPLVAVTLSVRKLGLHWQKVFRADEPIPLGRVLFEAWSEADQLCGMPDVLYVDPQFPASFPLRDLINELHPLGKGPEISTAGERSFGSSKREAQKLLSHHIDWGRFSGNEPEQVEDTDALLSKMNATVASYLGFWSVETLSKSTNESQQKRLEYTRLAQHPVSKPERPVAWPELEVGDIQGTNAFTAQAYDVEEKPSHLDLVIYHEISRVKWLRVGIGDRPEPVNQVPYDDRWLGAMRDKGYLWKDEYPEFVSTLFGLPFPPVHLFLDAVHESNVDGFMRGREPIPKGYVDAAVEKLRGSSYVFLPLSLQSLIHTYDFTSGGGDIEWSCELVSGQANMTDYRFFAYGSDWAPVNLIVMRPAVQLEMKYPASRIFGQYVGEVGVGAQAMAMLEHQFHHHVIDGGIEDSQDFMAMLNALIEACPQLSAKR